MPHDHESRMANPSALGAHDFIDWLVGCDSIEEIRDAIRDWMQVNPRPSAVDEKKTRTDSAHASWDARSYDPLVVAPAIAELEEIAARIVRESGREAGFDAAAWVREWIHEPHSALGGRCPVHLLNTQEGVGQVRDLLWRQQTGTYW